MKSAEIYNYNTVSLEHETIINKLSQVLDYAWLSEGIAFAGVMRGVCSDNCSRLTSQSRRDDAEDLSSNYPHLPVIVHISNF